MWPIVLCPAHEQPDQRNCNWCKSWFVVAPSNSHHLLFCTLVRVDHNTNAFGCLGAFWKANFGTVVMASVYRFQSTPFAVCVFSFLLIYDNLRFIGQLGHDQSTCETCICRRLHTTIPTNYTDTDTYVVLPSQLWTCNGIYLSAPHNTNNKQNLACHAELTK